MRIEHALTYQSELSIANIEYLAQKANRLGKRGCDIVRVHSETDKEGVHIYFDVVGLNET